MNSKRLIFKLPTVIVILVVSVALISFGGTAEYSCTSNSYYSSMNMVSRYNLTLYEVFNSPDVDTSSFTVDFLYQSLDFSSELSLTGFPSVR